MVGNITSCALKARRIKYWIFRAEGALAGRARGKVYVVLWRIFNLAGRAAEAKAYFGARLAQGIGLLLIVQVMFHFAVNLGLVPTKGLNLPLMSYGGSSMLINGLAFGLLVSIEHSLSKGRVGAR